MTLARILVVAMLSLASISPAGAQSDTQTILVWNFGFAPNPIHLVAGRPVTLTFVNRSGGSHDFVAHSFFARSTIIAGAAGEGEIDLPSHATRTITLIPRTGNYSAHCSHFLHKQFGMSDQIIVN